MTGSNPNSKNCERRPRTKLSRIADQVVHCKACSRLVEYRQKIAHQRKRAFKDWTYWGRPVPSFGDPRAEFVIIGLAPAAHGANRTGRMFTGDSSGSVVAYYPPSKSYVYQPPLERCVYQPPPKEYYVQPAPQHYVVQPPPEYVYYPPPVTYVFPSPVQKRFYQPPAQAYVVQPPPQQYLYQPPLQEYSVQAPPKTYMYYPPPRRLSLPP